MIIKGLHYTSNNRTTMVPEAISGFFFWFFYLGLGKPEGDHVIQGARGQERSSQSVCPLD